MGMAASNGAVPPPTPTIDSDGGGYSMPYEQKKNKRAEQLVQEDEEVTRIIKMFMERMSI